jgi:fumarate hydratase class II
MSTTSHRTERDTMGTIEVPADRYWGAQTQRSFQNFEIGDETMRRPLIRAIGLVKQSAAEVNAALGGIDPELSRTVQAAAQEVIDGALDDHFPLVVWQTGSGTQTNMNANEVIANRANEMLGQPLGEQSPVHPNDHVNHAQSTNDSFPTAIHVAAACEIDSRLLPAIRRLRDCLEEKASAFDAIVKIGRTHLQDATPLTLGQEFSGYADQLRICQEALEHALDGLLDLPIGGTAVGTGLNTRPGYAEQVPAALAARTGLPFRSAPNKFASMAGKEALVHASGATRTLAGALTKIANDVRWLASGPRCGIGEILIPANEPGSSIMPGKVNPTQCEALTMLCTRVFGNDVTVGMAGSAGNFELNVYMPVIADAVLQSVDLLASGIESFTSHCALGIEPNHERIEENLHRSLMLVTALNPHIGYDKAADIAKTAYKEGKTLRQVGIEKGYLTGEDFDAWVVPADMVHPSS